MSSIQTNAPVASTQPPRYKTAAVIWLAIFPLITLVLAVFGPWLNMLPLIARTFVLTVVLVPVMIFGLVPIISRVLAGWLNRT